MDILNGVSLKPYNTFGIDVTAKYFCEVKNLLDVEALVVAPEFLQNERLFVGGGSNILFTKNFDGIVIKNSLKGITIIDEDEKTVTVKVASGENWHDFVMWTVAHDFGGIENLALIPGTVGGAPMQNIGAYGVEAKSVIQNVEAVHVGDGTVKVFSNAECDFGYRTSAFKTTLKNQYFMTAVTFILSKSPHALHTEYGAIQGELEAMHVLQPTIRDVADAIIAIRSSKLPQPDKLGNAGSFFKNPEISSQQFAKLQTQFPDIPSYPTESGLIKIPAGWLIEQAGWKGKRVGNSGMHEKQALVLVNYGGATGSEMLSLAQAVQKDVQEKFDISLETEVWIY